jgi:hypothetical protein
LAINAQNRSLPDWFTKLRTRQTVLPRFQRFEAWDYSSITQLFNTILRGLPVGAVLILEIGNEEPFISRPLEGTPTTGDRITEHLLDGQQRLTGLWKGLHNSYEDRTFFLVLEKDDDTGMPYYVDSISRWKNEKDMALRPFWANEPEGQWKKRMIPLDLCSPEIQAQQNFRSWAKQAASDTTEREDLTDQIVQIRQQFMTFNLPFLSLPVGTNKETALDVFIKMNTSAAPLTTYDIVVAQVEAGMGQSLHDLVAATRQSCPAIAAYYPPEELALYASALLQDSVPANATYMSKTFGGQLIAKWDIFLRGVSRTVDFLEQEKVFDAARLLTDVIVPVLVALWAIAPEGLDAEGNARTILRKYMWRAFFSSRYEKSTNARALVDFRELELLVTGRRGTSPTAFDEEDYPLPQPEELIEAGWPVRKDRLARAILAAALMHGGLDLADGGTATRENLAKREYHHLFPAAHLARQGVSDDEIYRSLNCALVSWRTNRNISDKEPERYLAARRDGTNLGEKEVRTRLDSHLIPYDQMVAGNYQDFLKARAALVHVAMKRVCEGDAG